VIKARYFCESWSEIKLENMAKSEKPNFWTNKGSKFVQSPSFSYTASFY